LQTRAKTRARLALLEKQVQKKKKKPRIMKVCCFPNYKNNNITHPGMKSVPCLPAPLRMKHRIKALKRQEWTDRLGRGGIKADREDI